MHNQKHSYTWKKTKKMSLSVFACDKYLRGLGEKYIIIIVQFNEKRFQGNKLRGWNINLNYIEKFE